MTANLQEWQNGSNSKVGFLNSGGNLSIAGNFTVGANANITTTLQTTNLIVTGTSTGVTATVNDNSTRLHINNITSFGSNITYYDALNVTYVKFWINQTLGALGSIQNDGHTHNFANISSGVNPNQLNYTNTQIYNRNITINGTSAIIFNSTAGIYKSFNGTCIIEQGVTSRIEVC